MYPQSRPTGFRLLAVFLALAAAVAAAVGWHELTARAGSPYLQHDGTTFRLDGNATKLVGVNAYSIGTVWGSNLGCGGPIDPDALFSSLPAHSAVRIWGWQGSMAVNAKTHQRDWTGLDKVVASAQAHGVLLIVSLTSQGGECDDGHWKDRAWYAGGYRGQWQGDGYAVTTTSYWDYVHEIVSRYANSTAIGMWELVNEPQASDCPAGKDGPPCSGHQTCPDEHAAALALRNFFDTVGGTIKRTDPNHLVESGLLGGGECGTAGDDYAYVNASAGIDVTSYHDYGDRDTALPGDGGNGLAARLRQSERLGKPLMVGESGIKAHDGVAGCESLSARRDQFQRKLGAAFSAGAGGYLLWNFVAKADHSCSYDIATGDPALEMLGSYRAP